MDSRPHNAYANFARHIAALANNGGGYLVFNVDDAPGATMVETSLDRVLFSQGAIAGIFRKYLDPPVAVWVEAT
jgi:hypothetical protein